ncbi:LOW QUALITY PROTEIN: hypothetical protein U9M48_007434 [Paspalum notatum var. saurae]|uniref:Uncharacterized protein n=1 Tax=Paspalum notatum var. saurae TaxID=547442 RepID=A0AAQ3SH14_PASNO
MSVPSAQQPDGDRRQPPGADRGGEGGRPAPSSLALVDGVQPRRPCPAPGGAHQLLVVLPQLGRAAQRPRLGAALRLVLAGGGRDGSDEELGRDLDDGAPVVGLDVLEGALGSPRDGRGGRRRPGSACGGRGRPAVVGERGEGRGGEPGGVVREAVDGEHEVGGPRGEPVLDGQHGRGAAKKASARHTTVPAATSSITCPACVPRLAARDSPPHSTRRAARRPRDDAHKKEGRQPFLPMG